ncbi:MAG: nicotinate phosphoribosyltransferase [Bacteroidales bacterium]|nr:nicotinate phosphoribosyltransferase [Bacteroidales bacterium]
MSILENNTGLYTDHYELTMAQGYFLSGKQNTRANFDYFFRRNPYQSGFVLFAGLADLLETIENYRFEEEDCQYLQSAGFHKKFTQYLKSFKFNGTIHAVREGEIVFPNEPVVRVEGNIIETQLIETLLLNILNFQSLIATKAARIRLVARDKLLIDFGMRRAQGLGAIHASRAAIIGGFNGTSNVYSAFQFGFDSSGTMAHSWIQTFDNELDAFREFARFNPDNAILLVDTYDTLKMGIPNAIKVAKELEKSGRKLLGIRLDSGDLAYLSKEARKMLDKSDLDYVKIVASNQLDEHIIRSLMEQEAPIDAFGVGTALVIGKDEGALDGVYKLSHVNNKPTMKLSENISKMTLPGIKNIYRYYHQDDSLFYADGIELQNKEAPQIIYHPQQPEKNVSVKDLMHEAIINKVMENGKPLYLSSIEDVSEYARTRISQLDSEYKRFENPHLYKVGIGRELMNLRDNLKSDII